MFNRIARKLAVGVAFFALVTPAVYATPMGTDPEPGAVSTKPGLGTVQVILTVLGLA
jgi:hypothetical protein